MRPLAILRPKPGASATAEAARSLGLNPIVVPLFRIEPVDWTAPDPSRFDALLITSANAVRWGEIELGRLRALPVHAVGEATAAAARQAGFTVQTVGRDGIDALLQKLPPGRLLHLCGAHRREPGAPSQDITILPVYCSSEIPLPDRFGSIDGAIVMVHSPRAALRLTELAGQTGLARNRTAIAAISPAAAAAAGQGWERAEAAVEPNDQALLALAAWLCQNGSR